MRGVVADPMLRALAGAADDDEPSSPEEDDSALRALAAYERGEALSPSELKSDLGITWASRGLTS